MYIFFIFIYSLNIKITIEVILITIEVILITIEVILITIDIMEKLSYKKIFYFNC